MDLTNMSPHELAKRVFVLEAAGTGMLTAVAENVWKRHEAQKTEVYRTRIIFAAAHITSAIELMNEANAEKIPFPSVGIRALFPFKRKGRSKRR